MLDRRAFLQTTMFTGMGMMMINTSGFTQNTVSSSEKAIASKPTVPQISIHRVEADGVSIFYREAGPKDAPVLLLLHGYPTSSFQFRELMPLLADKYHVIAPDLPGFGFTEVPSSREYKYTFENIAKTIDAFTQAVGLNRFALYIFDYGAPTGLRLALKNPEKITAIITQNGNAYEEGLGAAWTPVQKYWQEPTSANREALRGFYNYDGIREQYVTSPHPELVKPEGYTLDAALMARPGNVEIQLDLILDYRTNVALYPEFQRYFREKKPRTLAVWGEDDPYFIPAGAKAFKKDNPNAEVHLLNAGHFALETDVVTVAHYIREFLGA